MKMFSSEKLVLQSNATLTDKSCLENIINYSNYTTLLGVAYEFLGSSAIPPSSRCMGCFNAVLLYVADDIFRLTTYLLEIFRPLNRTYMQYSQRLLDRSLLFFFTYVSFSFSKYKCYYIGTCRKEISCQQTSSTCVKFYT